MKSGVWMLVVVLMMRGTLGATIGKEIQDGIAVVKQPIDESIAYVGSTQCNNVKKIIGVAYDQLEGEDEPDVNKLTLQYRNEEKQVIYNITQASRAIPEEQQFRPGGKLVVFVHGFTDDPSKNSFGNISDAFIKKGEYVVALDGSSLIHWLYLRSTTYVRFMGEKLGEVLAAISKDGVNPKDIHLVGHSLGSHISSFAGKTFFDITGNKIGRISGLDPAGPCFSHIDPELRLKPSDAAFVDVIHTDAGVYGLADPVGHVDFYPNSGAMQPNCVLQTCSHSRAWIYYSESVVNPKAFPARRCKDWDAFKEGNCEKVISYMGYPATPYATGKFYLQTGEESPYGRGENGLIYMGERSHVKNLATGGKDAAKSVISSTINIFG